jgi:thiamine transporter
MVRFLHLIGATSHTIYGAIFFATFMPKDWSNPFVYSIAYNAAFLLPDLAICLAVGVMIYKPMKRYIVKF